MKKILSTTYTFTPGASTVGTVDLSGITNFDIKKLYAILNTTRDQMIYAIAQTGLGYSAVSGSVITLEFNTTGMSGSDSLSVLYEAADGYIEDFDAVTIGNARNKFRDGFVQAWPDLTVWDLSLGSGNNIVNGGGNSAGSAYLRISLDPLTANTEVSVTSKLNFKFPLRFGAGVSLSQRMLGQEASMELVGATTAGTAVENISTVSSIAISGNITVVSNVWTINTAAAHGLKGGDRITISGCADPRLNVGPIAITVVTATQITITSTLANATYTATSGVMNFADPFAYAKNGCSLLFETNTATTGTFATRRNGASYRGTTVASMASTTATQSNTSGFSDAFNAAGTSELYCSLDEIFLRSFASDSLAGTNSLTKYTQGIPDEELKYKIRFRAKNHANLTVPVGQITAISKSGTTTATVTTDVAHGLSVNDYVMIYGVRDQTNFANLATATVIASVPSSTTFTIVLGSAVTASSAGGVVWRIQGSVAPPGILNFALQSIARTSNVLTATFNTTVAGPLPGEYFQLHGLDGSAATYNGAYKVLRTNASTVEFESTGSDFTSINAGGALIRRTDYRIHFAKLMDYTRHVTEIVGGRGVADANNAVPTVIANAPNIGTVTTVTGVTTVSAVTAANLGLPILVNDVVSAAITSSATTAAVTPTSGTAQSFNIAVTATSGTSQTLDVGVEESDDTGTNWFRIYDFPRITATGSYRSPMMRLSGNRIRYVQTVAGTTPSFTRAINRVTSSAPGSVYKQIVDRTIVPNNASSTGTALFSEGLSDFNLVVRVTAQTTAATIRLQASEDGTNWADIVTSDITTAVGVVRSSYSNLQAKFVRPFVFAAGSGITLGEVVIKGVE